MEEILVFKTNVVQGTDLAALSELLNINRGVKSWNFDFQDSDNIFRVVSNGITSDEVSTILAFCNIQAKELLD
ncbi:MAG: hypothetical protein J0I32_09390 [Sphingobacteriales bacterium]|nr:hypothetical protein [Sphingobacteriales bacterium]